MVVLNNAKKRLSSIEKKTLVILFFLVLISLIYKSKKIVLGILFGGCLSLGNIIFLSKIIENIFQQTKPSKTPIMVGYLFKILLLFGMLYVLIAYDLVNIIAFIIGFSSIFIAVGIESVFPSRHQPS